MDRSSFIIAAVSAIAMAAGLEAQTQPPPPVPMEQRGLPVGAKIPALAAEDQTGKVRTFDSLTGPKGFVLLFVRSADW